MRLHYILSKVDPGYFNPGRTRVRFRSVNRALLTHDKGTLRSKRIDINSGIFQGDWLSPLIFCLALASLSTILNGTGYGYKIQDRFISHMLYIDDLKLFAKDDNNQEGMLQLVKNFSGDIGITFGLDKCAKASFKRGKMTRSASLELDG